MKEKYKVRVVNHETKGTHLQAEPQNKETESMREKIQLHSLKK